MNVDSLEAKTINCFGYTYPKTQDWKHLAEKSISAGWKNIDVDKLQKSLAANVLSSYKKLCEFKIVDLESDFEYTIWFDNDQKQWNLDYSNLKSKADIPPIEDRKAIFTCEMVKRICRRAYEKIIDGYKSLDELVLSHIESGELLDVDEIKLDRIVDLINDSSAMTNFKMIKFVK